MAVTGIGRADWRGLKTTFAKRPRKEPVQVRNLLVEIIGHLGQFQVCLVVGEKSLPESSRAIAHLLRESNIESGVLLNTLDHIIELGTAGEQLQSPVINLTELAHRTGVGRDWVKTSFFAKDREMEGRSAYYEICRLRLLADQSPTPQSYSFLQDKCANLRNNPSTDKILLAAIIEQQIYALFKIGVLKRNPQKIIQGLNYYPDALNLIANSDEPAAVKTRLIDDFRLITDDQEWLNDPDVLLLMATIAENNLLPIVPKERKEALFQKTYLLYNRLFARYRQKGLPAEAQNILLQQAGLQGKLAAELPQVSQYFPAEGLPTLDLKCRQLSDLVLNQPTKSLCRLLFMVVKAYREKQPNFCTNGAISASFAGAIYLFANDDFLMSIEILVLVAAMRDQTYLIARLNPASAFYQIIKSQKKSLSDCLTGNDDQGIIWHLTKLVEYSYFFGLLGKRLNQPIFFEQYIKLSAYVTRALTTARQKVRFNFLNDINRISARINEIADQLADRLPK
jgi:hypothetical protein